MLRFRLRTLLIVWTVILIPLGWIGYVRELRRRERTAVQELIRGRIVEYDSSLPKQSKLDRFLFGDTTYRQIEMLAAWMPMDGRTGLREDSKTWSRADLNALRWLPALKDLYLHFGSISDEDLKIVTGLPQLELLSLDGCPNLTDAGMEQLSHLAHLRVLGLRQTRITDRGLTSLHSLSELEVLDLEETAITDAGLLHLRNLDRLKALYLSETQVKGEGWEPWIGVLPLHELTLSRTPFNGKGLRYLKEIKTLEYLEMEHTKVTDDCVVELLGHPRMHTCLVWDTLVSQKMQEAISQSTHKTSMRISEEEEANARVSP